MDKLIKIEQHDEITILTIDRPDALNSLNTLLLKELKVFLEEIISKKSCKGLILTGSGEKAFIAGADIKEMSLKNQNEIEQFCQLGQDVANLLETAPFLTLAAVNGYALGGGLEMALACDFIYASDRAKLGLPEVTLGLIPGFGGTQRLIRAIGIRRAKEMILSGMIIDASTAKEFGVVNEVYSKEKLLEAALTMAKKVVALPQTATSLAKAAINQAGLIGIDEGLKLEKKLFSQCFATTDRVHAMEAFIHKGAKK